MKSVIYLLSALLLCLPISSIYSLKAKEDRVFELYLYSGTESSLYYKPESLVTGANDEAKKLFLPHFFIGLNTTFILFDDTFTPFLDLRFGNSAIRGKGKAPTIESFQDLESADAVGFTFGSRIKFYKEKRNHLYIGGTYGGIIPTVEDAKKGFFNEWRVVIGNEIRLKKVDGTYIEVGVIRNDVIDRYLRGHLKTHIRLVDLLFISVGIDNDLGDKVDDLRFMLGYQSRVIKF